MERTERMARLYPQLVAGMGRMRALVHEGIDLTSNQYKTLLAVAGRGECSLGDLARTLEVAMSSASQMVDRLVSQGLSEGEAAQMIAIVLRNEMKQMISESRSFDDTRFAALLQKLPTLPS